MTRRTLAASLPRVIFCKNSSNRVRSCSTVQGAPPALRASSRSAGFTVHGDQAGQGRLHPLDEIVARSSRGASSPSGSPRPPPSVRPASRLMLFLAVGSSRLSSSVLRPVLQQACRAAGRSAGGPPARWLRAFSSWGRKLQCGQIGEASRSSLTSVKHGCELRQTGLKLGQGGVRQKGNPAASFFRLVEPGVLEQFLLLLVLVDPEPGLLVQVEVGRLVVVLRLLERPVDLLAEVGRRSERGVQQLRPPLAADRFHLRLATGLAAAARRRRSPGSRSAASTLAPGRSGLRSA